jgi:hypothetical protein
LIVHGESPPRAVQVEGAIAPLSRCDPRLELGQPARCHLREGEPWRDRQLAHASEALEPFALNARLRKRSGIDGAETRPPLDHHADRVPSILLPVDPTSTRTRLLPPLLGMLAPPFVDLLRGESPASAPGRSYSSGNDGKRNNASMNRSRSTRSGAGS